MYSSLAQKPDSIVDACQALSKARELRAQFEKKEKPLITAKVHSLSYLLEDIDCESFFRSLSETQTLRLQPSPKSVNV